MTPSPTVAYDANGKTLGDGSKSYTWNFENQLTSATVPNVGTTTFRYDPFGRRIQKSGPLGTSNYVYDEYNVIEELGTRANAATSSRVLSFIAALLSSNSPS